MTVYYYAICNNCREEFNLYDEDLKKEREAPGSYLIPEHEGCEKHGVVPGAFKGEGEF